MKEAKMGVELRFSSLSSCDFPLLEIVFDEEMLSSLNVDEPGDGLTRVRNPSPYRIFLRVFFD